VAATEARLRSWAGADSPQWIIARQGSAALGRITLVETRRGVAEIGVMVVPAAQRRGLALQAVCAVTAWALSEGGRVRVFADLDPDNVASERLFRRAGYGFEARQTATWVTHTGVADSLVFAATRGWQAPDPTRATAAPPTGCSA
jgi:RimJ/RimL family protein N-acetyltransferase